VESFSLTTQTWTRQANLVSPNNNVQNGFAVIDGSNMLLINPGYNKFLVFNDTDYTFKISNPASSFSSAVAVAIEITDASLMPEQCTC
jgi:hypothetical protein